MNDQTAADLLFGGSMKTSGDVAVQQSEPAAGPIEEKAAKLYSGPEKYVSPFDMPKVEADAAKQGAKPETDKANHQAEAGNPEAVKELASALEEDMGLDPADPINREFAQLMAGELGLDKEGAQKLLELDLKNRETYWNTVSEQWREATEAEFSEAEIISVRQTVHRYGDAELMDLLESHALGNNPAIVRFVRNVARAIQGRR